jgi:hypothetical protein
MSVSTWYELEFVIEDLLHKNPPDVITDLQDEFNARPYYRHPLVKANPTTNQIEVTFEIEATVSPEIISKHYQEELYEICSGIIPEIDGGRVRFVNIKALNVNR